MHLRRLAPRSLGLLLGLSGLGLRTLGLRSVEQPWEADGISTAGSVARYAGAIAISAIVWVSVLSADETASGWVPWLDVALTIVAFGLVHQRRRHPLPIAVGLCFLSIFSAGAVGPATLASVSVAARRQLIPVLTVGIANLIAAQAFSWWMQIEGTSYLIELGVNAAFISAMMAWGMYVGSRRELLHNLKLRADQAEAEQELRAAKAKGDERARIAREMHDVLAHRISQVSMLSGALAFRDDLTAPQMREHASVIQSQANAALDEMRAVLGVLRDRTSGELLDRPQPTWADVPDLIAEFRDTGGPLSFENDVENDGSMAATTGRAAYRVVQEAVTNARKHAPGAVVRIEAHGGPEEGLHLRVRNPLGFGQAGAPGSGLGLVGLSERTEQVGGTLAHGRKGDEFVLEVWLPWTA